MGKLLQLFPIGDVELRKCTLRLLFNLSFDPKARARMVTEGLVAHVAPLIESMRRFFIAFVVIRRIKFSNFYRRCQSFESLIPVKH